MGVFIDMDLNIDNIINTLNKFSIGTKSEFVEQDDSSSSSSSSPTSSVKKWESGRKMGKTYGGPGFKWESGRTFGKTYMNDPKNKWYSGVQRGKANPASES